MEGMIVVVAVFLLVVVTLFKGVRLVPQGPSGLYSGWENTKNH